MGPLLLKWFLYCILISILAGYMGEAALDRTAPYMAVFRVVGTAAPSWAMPAAVISGGIWLSRPWSTVFKDILTGRFTRPLTGAALDGSGRAELLQLGLEGTENSHRRDAENAEHSQRTTFAAESVRCKCSFLRVSSARFCVSALHFAGPTTQYMASG